ncbi:hypothetical protein LINPERHAP1_LOCUS34532 [Linum perenne]
MVKMVNYPGSMLV